MVSIGGNRAFRVSVYDALVARCCARARRSAARGGGGDADSLEAAATARLLALVLLLDLLCAALLQAALHGWRWPEAFALARFDPRGRAGLRVFSNDASDAVVLAAVRCGLLPLIGAVASVLVAACADDAPVPLH